MVICADESNSKICLANGFIGRMSFILVLFHLVVFLICLGRNEMAAAFHDGCWAFKLLLIFGGYVGSFWIDSSFFTGFYMPVAFWLSAIFLFY